MLIRFYAFLKYKLKKVEINHKIQYTMVIDTLDNLEKYVSLNPLFTEVVKFINETDLTKLETGKHPIQGDDLFVNIAVAHGKTEEEATIEAHRQMIDIQIPMNTEETYGYSPVKDLPEVEYNEAKDCTLYRRYRECAHRYLLQGWYGIGWRGSWCRARLDGLSGCCRTGV